MLSIKFVGIDLGSQFYKWAESLPDGQVKITRDKATNSVTFPSAASVRMSVPHELPFSPRQLEDIEVRFGRRAVASLKANTSLGFEYLPRVISREKDTEFYTGTIANASELFILMLQDAFTKAIPFDALAIGIPSFYTRDQIAEITEVSRIFQVPLLAIIDDASAVLTLYGTHRTSRFAKEDKHVMFVDVGATSTKVYSGVFKYNKDNMSQIVLVNMTSNDWSENIGGYFFGKAVADAKGVPVRKGQKMLLRNNGEGMEQFVQSETTALEDLVRDAVRRAELVKPIDEVQMIGGASTLKFVVEAVKRATNHTIRRDFNANEAVAMGTLIRAMLNEDESPYIQTLVIRTPPMSLSVKYGDQVMPYCKKGESCVHVVEFEGVEDVSDRIEIIRGDDSLIAGGQSLDAIYNLVNASNVTTGENVRVRFMMQAPSPVIEEAQVCQGETCERIGIRSGNVPPSGYVESVRFVTEYLGSRQNAENRAHVRQLLERLNSVKERFENSNVEAPYPMTDEMKEVISSLMEQKERDDFESLDAEGLESAKEKLEKVKQGLHLND